MNKSILPQQFLYEPVSSSQNLNTVHLNIKSNQVAYSSLQIIKYVEESGLRLICLFHKFKRFGANEKAQCLKACTALIEDQSSVSATNIGQFMTACNASSRESVPLATSGIFTVNT